MDKERLEEIKEDYELRSLMGYEWISIPRRNFNWLLKTVEEQQKVMDQLADGTGKLNVFLQSKSTRFGDNVVDIAIDLINEQQKEIDKLNTLDRLYELVDENARLREALEFYANRQAYYYTSEHQSEVMKDYGEKARQALGESK